MTNFDWDEPEWTELRVAKLRLEALSYGLSVDEGAALLVHRTYHARASAMMKRIATYFTTLGWDAIDRADIDELTNTYAAYIQSKVNSEYRAQIKSLEDQFDLSAFDGPCVLARVIDDSGMPNYRLYVGEVELDEDVIWSAPCDRSTAIFMSKVNNVPTVFESGDK